MAQVIRFIGLMLVAIAIGCLGYLGFSYATAEGRVRDICSGIKPGMSSSELGAFAESRGLGAPSRESGVVFIAEKRTFGRYGCKVTLEAGRVLSAQYDFAS